MPLAALRALASHHADLSVHLAPADAPEPEARASLVAALLPRFAMTCTTRDEADADARRREETRRAKAEAAAADARESMGAAAASGDGGGAAGMSSEQEESAAVDADGGVLV